ncbi:uncharacterized protein RCC_05680 [Ramularia collo-cygni]|uniref:Uncharacterized protein n=1 Tax=Ramularia collo-cygni TaxID=112498 RepID=A0A2D3VAY0_9PEZI|nr:uncharacterized protein RCC_05680 [Ramularia collo-cygni]CZT19824.1 uncharacterized protein RCC_05680 [Ramularia collo-cygni]
MSRRASNCISNPSSDSMHPSHRSAVKATPSGIVETVRLTMLDISSRRVDSERPVNQSREHFRSSCATDKFFVRLNGYLQIPTVASVIPAFSASRTLKSFSTALEEPC